MTQVIYQGFYDDLAAGNVTSSADLRVMAVMSDTTIATAGQEDAQTLSDFTDMDECDGVGYAQHDIANVAVAYDSTDNHLVIDGDDGDLDGGTDIIQASSRNVTRYMVYRYVDGTDANDVPWMSEAVGPFTLTGGPFDILWNSAGILYLGSA
jgi:hypothetical protein